MTYKIELGTSLKVNIEIPKLESLEKHSVWKKRPQVNANRTIQRINHSIPKRGGVYFLFYSDKRLLYIGKSANIRQRINGHTKIRSVHEIAEETKRNPKHIYMISWLILEDEGSREIVETAYLRTYGTAWNQDKIDKNLSYPAAPIDEDLHLPEVQTYIKKQHKIIDEAIEATGW